MTVVCQRPSSTGRLRHRRPTRTRWPRAIYESTRTQQENIRNNNRKNEERWKTKQNKTKQNKTKTNENQNKSIEMETQKWSSSQRTTRLSQLHLFCLSVINDFRMARARWQVYTPKNKRPDGGKGKKRKRKSRRRTPLEKKKEKNIKKQPRIPK